MLGMIFGVGAVIAMLSIGAGAELQAMEMIDRMGLRNMLVRNPAISPTTSSTSFACSRSASRCATRPSSRTVCRVVELTAPRVEVDTYMIMAPGTQTRVS